MSRLPARAIQTVSGRSYERTGWIFVSYQCDAVLSRLAAGDTSVAIAVQPFERVCTSGRPAWRDRWTSNRRTPGISVAVNIISVDLQIECIRSRVNVFTPSSPAWTRAGCIESGRMMKHGSALRTSSRRQRRVRTIQYCLILSRGRELLVF